MLMGGVGVGIVRLEVCRTNLVVGIGAEVEYHNGDFSESERKANGVSERLEILFLAVDGAFFFLA